MHRERTPITAGVDVMLKSSRWKREPIGLTKTRISVVFFARLAHYPTPDCIAKT